MKVTITTDGGFTGRGLGTATADVDAADLHPELWRPEYTSPGADLIRYTLTIGEHRVSWVEGAEIPEELAALFARVWGRGGQR
jgi:hypothetical protein